MNKKLFAGSAVVAAAVALLAGGCSTTPKAVVDETGDVEVTQSTSDGDVTTNVSYAVITVKSELKLYSEANGEEVGTVSPGDYVIVEEDDNGWVLVASEDTEGELTPLGWLDTNATGDIEIH